MLFLLSYSHTVFFSSTLYPPHPNNSNTNTYTHTTTNTHSTTQYQAGVNREIWQAGGALRPYFEDVEAIVSQKDSIPELHGHPIVSADRLSFDHCPIIDCGVTDDSKVLALAQKLTQDISEGEVIYLHCWGGHGRTGTVVCIMLYLLYGVGVRLICCCI